MRFLVILVVIGFVGIVSTQLTSDSPSTTPGDATTTAGDGGDTSAPTTNGATDGSTNAPASTEAPGSTASPGPTEAPGSTPSPGPTDAPNTGSTVENTNPTNPNPATTTLATTLPPTTTPPLKRDVSFNIDCSTGSQCSFAFRIAEPLMRFVNTTILESVLTNLTSKINDLNQASSDLSQEEQTYITTLQKEIDTLTADVESLNENLNGTISDAQTLQELTQNASITAQNYLSAALCFRNDGESSEACGQIAFG